VRVLVGPKVTVAETGDDALLSAVLNVLVSPVGGGDVLKATAVLLLKVSAIGLRGTKLHVGDYLGSLGAVEIAGCFEIA
jgi:hypothetical protein